MGEAAQTLQNTETSSMTWLDNVLPAYDEHGVPNFQSLGGELVEGIYTDLPNDIYHSLPALSSSQLKKFSESPAHYYREYRSDIDRTRSLATQRTFDTGSMGHELLLEPEGFTDRYFKLPKPKDFPCALHTAKDMSLKCEELGLAKSGSKNELMERLIGHNPDIEIYDRVIEATLRKEAGDEAVDAALDMVASSKSKMSLLKAFDSAAIKAISLKEPLDPVIWDDAHRIANVARQHPYIDRLIKDGFPELAVIAKDPATGMMLKCKYDWLRFDAIAVDVKTSRSAAPEKFAYQAADLGYDLQQEFYKHVGRLRSIPVEHFVFTVIEFAAADIAEPYELTEQDAVIARADLHRLLGEFKYCDDNTDWYGYTNRDRISVLKLPRRRR